MQAPEALLETEGLPDYEGPHSLLDALLSPGGLVGMRLRECRALATLSKHWKTIVDGQEVWRLCCAMLAREYQLYAPAACADWKRTCLRTLWPVRHKWSGGASGGAEDERQQEVGVGFQIGVAVRVRPRRHGRSERGVVLPLHQRLKTLKKGEKLSFAEAALPAEQIAQMAKEQGDVPPELFQALLEAAQLEASAAQAQAQAQAATARPGGGAAGADEGAQQGAVDGAQADVVAAAGADAASEAGGVAGGGKDAATGTADGGAKRGDRADKENAEGANL